MRFLIFLLLGTLVFGFAFPAMIMFLGLIAIAVFAMIIYNLLRGGSYFKVTQTELMILIQPDKRVHRTTLKLSRKHLKKMIAATM